MNLAFYFTDNLHVSLFHLPWIETGGVQTVGCLLITRVHPHNLHGDDEGDDAGDGLALK